VENWTSLEPVLPWAFQHRHVLPANKTVAPVDPNTHQLEFLLRSALYPQIAPQRVARWLYARRALEAMVVPLQEIATPQIAAGRLARREPLHMGHSCVAALANGTTIIAHRALVCPMCKGSVTWFMGKGQPLVFTV